MDSGDPARSPSWSGFDADVRRSEFRFEDKQGRDALVQLLRRPALGDFRDRRSSPPSLPSSAASAADGVPQAPAGPPWEGQGGGGGDDDSTGTAGSDSNPPPLEGTEIQVTDLPVSSVEGSAVTGRRHRKYDPVLVGELERHFQRNPYPNLEEILRLELVTALEHRKIRVWFQNRRARQRRLFRKVGYPPDSSKSQSSTTSDTVHHFQASSLTSSRGVSSCASVHGSPVLRTLLDPNDKAVSSVSDLTACCFSTASSRSGQYPERSLHLQGPVSGQNYASYHPNFYGARTDSPMREGRTACAGGSRGYYKDHSWHNGPYADGRLNEYSTAAHSDFSSYWSTMSFNWNNHIIQGPHSSCTAGLSSRNMSTCRVISGYVPEETGYNYGMPFSYPVVNWNCVAGTAENRFQLTWNASSGTNTCELVNWNAVSGNPFVAVREENLASFHNHQQPDWCALCRYRDVENAGSTNNTENTSQVDRETDVLKILLEKEMEELEVFSRTIVVEPDSTVNHYFGCYNEMQDHREDNVHFVSQPVSNCQTANFSQPFETVCQDGSNIWNNCPASHISCVKPYRNFQMISEVKRVYQTESRLDGGNFLNLLPIIGDVRQNDLLQVVQNTSRIARVQDPLRMVQDRCWNSSSSSCLADWRRHGNGNLSLDVQNNRSIVHSESSLYVNGALPQSSMHQSAPMHGFPAQEWNWMLPTSRFNGYPTNPPCVQNQNGWNQQYGFDFSNGTGFQSSSSAATNRWSDVGPSGGQLAEVTTERDRFVEPVAQDQEITAGDVIDCDGIESISADSSEMNSSSTSQL